jgi:hypothetical protein
LLELLRQLPALLPGLLLALHLVLHIVLIEEHLDQDHLPLWLYRSDILS